MQSKLMEKLIAKKKASGKELSDNEKQAKSEVLKSLHGQASDILRVKLKGIKKVSVMSDSPEGLEKGLDKAKELLEAAQGSNGDNILEHDSDEADEVEGEGAMEGDDSNGAEPEAESEDELDAKIQELLKKKEALKSKK